MKLLKSFCLLALGTGLLFSVACNKEDDSPSASKEAMLVGTWDLIKSGSDLNNDRQLQSQEVIDTDDSLMNIVMRFEEDHTGWLVASVMGFSDTTSIDWKLSGGKKLEITDGNEISYAEIYELTSTELTVLAESDTTSMPDSWHVFQKK